MSTKLHFPKSLQDAIVYFADPVNAFNFVKELRWPGGVTCPRCHHDKVGFISTRRIWKCKGCKKQFSVKVGSIFEDSPLGLDKWLAGIWLLANAKNSISSHEVGRALGITQKSAWFMVHRIALAMETRTFEKFTGPVEADETFIGGKEQNKHKSKRLNAGGGTVGKACVMGLLDRKTKQVKTKHIEKVSPKLVQPEVRNTVEPGSELHTDTATAYRGLSSDYIHKAVNHYDEYVKDGVHTNGLENYWSLFKRCVYGTWTHISDAHLHRYLVQEEFRYNNKGGKDDFRFTSALCQINGKRLTYQELID